MRALVYFLFVLSCFGASYTSGSQPRALAFEARGREYVSHGPGYSLQVISQGAVLNLRGHVLRMSVAGGNPWSPLEAFDHMPGKANYLLGRRVRQSYDLFGSVRQRSVYSGIDLVFRGNQEHLEYDFDIAAGRDPGRIKVRFEGADEIRMDPSGALVLRAGAFVIHQPAPIAYQVIAGTRTPVPAAYRLDASGLVGFRLGSYDRTQPLVIDPELVFDNSFGGSGSSSAAGIALDAQGNIYVAGQTNAADLQVQNAAQSHAGAAPLLVTADGGQTWKPVAVGPVSSVSSLASSPSTPSVMYLAGNPVSKSVDGGTTWTTPANSGLTAAPTMIAVDAGSPSTVYAAAAGIGVFTSTDGGASWTLSTKGLERTNTTPPAIAFLSGLFADPTHAGTVYTIALVPDLVYRSTDFGKTWSEVTLPVAHSAPAALAFSPADAKTLFLGQKGGDFLTSTDGGVTWTSLSKQDIETSQGLAIVPANPQVLLAAGNSQLSRSADGGITWTSVLPLFGGSVAADAKNPGVVYALDITGAYRSTDAGQTWTRAALPYANLLLSLFVSPLDSRVFVSEGTQTDAFVTKWSPDGKQVLYSTYLGGSGNDAASGIAVDNAGSAYVVGTTSSLDFPVSANAFQKQAGPGVDAFVAKLSPDGSRFVYSTLIGGGTEFTTRIAVNAAGEAVIVGGTGGVKFPVTSGAFQAAPVTPCTIQSPFVETSGSGFVTKVAADGGSLVFSTLLGGSCGTRAQAVAYDSGGNIWVGGYTDSPDFPVTSDAMQRILAGDIYDGFLARFNPAGDLAYASYLGGPKYDTITGLTLDAKNFLYVTGTSGGLSQPASPGAFASEVNISCVIANIGPGLYQATGSAFVMKLDPAAHTTLGLTYMGSPLCLFPSDIAVDASGQPWIAGPLSTFGSSPQTAGPLQIGIGSGFVSKFSADFTQLLFSTYFDSVAGIGLDSKGLAYVAGVGPLSASTATAQAYVAKIDPTPAAISLDAVQNAVRPSSPSNTQGIGPGEVLRILGKNMGPAAPTPGIITGGMLSATVAGVQVTFDGVAVPLLSVSAGEIDLVAPFELDGKTSTTVQVQYQGVKSNPVKVGVSGSVRFFGVPDSGVPLQVLGVYNGDFTVNSAANPARAGSLMTLYVSGIGQTVPPSPDGQVNTLPLPPVASPVLITPSGGGFGILVIQSVGAAPGMAAGIFQINFVAPQQSTANLLLQMGQGGATFDVQVKP